MESPKQKIVRILKENKIVSKVTIGKNRIDIKYEKDWNKVHELFPDTSIVYGFLD